MKKQILVIALFALLCVPLAALGQTPTATPQSKEPAAQTQGKDTAATPQSQDPTAQLQDKELPGQPHGFVEFGFRFVTGTVDNRTGFGEVPFSNGFRPDILNSGINIYRDYRNGFYIPRAHVYTDSFFGTKSYFSFQTASNGVAFNGPSMTRDQSHLVTLGRDGSYKLQFRWDQTPHITSGTTRSLYTQTSPGVWRYRGDRAALDAARVAGTAVALFNAVPLQAATASPDIQRSLRRNGSGLASWDINPDLNVAFFFSRERQTGTRPHAVCFGNNPSCYAAEVPENIDYLTHTLKLTTELGRSNWGLQLGLLRQSFDNNIPNMLVENPFSNNVNSTTVTSNGQMSLYPNNKTLNLLLGGALNYHNLHFMTSISPGWTSQNDPFVPYTTNTFLLTQTGAAAPIPLPAPSLDGKIRTLAMNYTVVFNPFKKFEVVARYRHYDHSNHTQERVFNPFVGDLSAEAALAGPSGQEVKEVIGLGGVLNPNCPGVCNSPYSFRTRTFELGGTWFFAKKSSAKVEYGRQWFDRENRDVKQTIEDTFKFSTDLKLTQNLTLRIMGAVQDRQPQDSEYEWFLIPGTQRPDEGFRRRYRADVLAQYDLTDRLSVSGFFRTVQDDFNRKNRLTSTTPLGDQSLITISTLRPTPIYGPYYVYGLLKDLSWNWGADFDFMLHKNVTLFGEYTRERLTERQVSRQRSSSQATQVGCPPPANATANQKADCDPINDWMTFERDIIDTYTMGTDLALHKRLNVSLYYSLAASKGNTFSDGVNCQIGQGPNDTCRNSFTNWRLDSATNRAFTLNFPETVSRLHEANVIVKYKLTESLSPKFEYRYQRFNYQDFQTSVMNPYSFVGPVIDPAGTTGLQRMIFLGADTPGYRAHVFTFGLVYSF